MAYPAPLRLPLNRIVDLPDLQRRHFVVCEHGRRDGTVNFIGHQSVYRFYDQTDRLLYVGVAWSIRRRFDGHRLKDWWPNATRIQVECFTSREEARARETLTIKTEAPLHNIAGVTITRRA